MAEAGRLIERLPTLITDMNDSVSALTRDGLRLHPDTVNAMSGGRRSVRWRWWVGATIAIGLLIAAN